jgi:hypothetical protein
MTRENFSKANEIIAEIRKVESEISCLYNSELKVNAEKESREWILYDIKISKQHLESIIKYNREVLNSKKVNLEKMLSNI